MQVSELNFLIVEDNEFQSHWLKVMLSNIGATSIFQASDGNEALPILKNKKNAIDISFIDLNLPGMDGMELIRHMSKQDPSTSIILSSALAPSLIFSVETMSKAYGVKLLGSVEKPATPETLLNLINRHQPLSNIGNDQDSLNISQDEIRRGLKEDEFVPFYQPKVELASGKVKGVEVFARWRHPKRGILSPDCFLASLQSAKEIDQLDLIICKKVIESFESLRMLNPDVHVSINLSPAACASQEFIEKLLSYADAGQFDLTNISFEIPESAAVENCPNFLENLVRLRMKGFGISIDKYGTAHSSVQQLLRVPFSELKIDRSMICDLGDSPALEIALGLGIELCRRLDCASVAVGVETRSDWDMLQKLGCNYAQGYYIAHPMEKDALAVWMKEWAEFF